MEQQAALTFLQQYLQEHLPLTVAMQVQAQQYNVQSLKLFAPLAANHNDKGTAFAGSLSSLATVCGWCLTMLWAKEHCSQACQVAVATAQIDFDILPALERRGFLLQDGNVLPHTSPSH